SPRTRRPRPLTLSTAFFPKISRRWAARDVGLRRYGRDCSTKRGCFDAHSLKRLSGNFLSKLRSTMVDPPPVLRCGIARGTVFCVGDGEDYVGSCINMAARLQRLQGISFAFNRRGFDLE